MKNTIKFLSIFIVLFLVSAQTNYTRFEKGTESDTLNISKVLYPEEYQKKSEQLMITFLSRYHYKKTNINDSLSSFIFDNYIEALDYNRFYFLASDVQKFELYRYRLDDDIKSAQLEPAYEMYNVFLQRVTERMPKIKQVINDGFDYSGDEYLEIDRKNVPWAKADEELNEIWRKKLKNEALSLKLTGKDDKAVKETLLKRYSNFEKRVAQSNSEDVFQLFMNEFAQAIDPHTSYFSPKSSEDFKINMSLSLEGIGATLGQEDEYTKVVELVVGGPAFKSKKINKNDRIVGVAQGEDGEMVDVVGWRLDDVVRLIRGPKDSIVRLQILEAESGSSIPKEISIVRDKIKLEEQAAKKEIIETTLDGVPFKLGVIKIPTFYMDFEAQQRGDKNYKSTTRDVKRLIKELKSEKVDGLIVDLRNNGGGSLQESIELTGLFIKDGPVVQVRSSDGSVEVGQDPDPDLVYDGPLAVLVNRFSASASEIFAGAIQDYQRGLILGETTYGKGTVQNLIDLNRFNNKSSEKLGQLKITIAKFYRIDGGSTQHKGVIPDIKFPSAIDTTEFGESSEPSALPWDHIKSTDYSTYMNLKKVVPNLVKNFESRKQENHEFRNLITEIEEYKTEQNKKVVSLNETIRKKEYEEAEAKKQKKNEKEAADSLSIVNKGEVSVQEKKTDDVLLKESANILADMILLSAK